MAFNTTSLYDIKIGTYSDSYSTLSEELITQLNQDEFQVTKIDSLDRCVNSIKTGDYHVCIIFPPDLNTNSEGKLDIYVDKTRVNIVWLILNSISSKISTKSSELSTALTNTLLSSLENANSKLDSSAILQVSTSLSEIKTKIASLTENINALSSSNISEIKEEIDDIESENNITLSTLSNLVSSLESSINTVTGTDLGSLSTDLSSSITNINSVKENVDAVVSDINAIEIKEVSKIVSPISTEIKPVASEETTHLNYTFPTLLVLVLLFAGLLIGSTTTVEEKSSKAYFRNFITPTTETTQLIGNYLSNLIIITIQVIIIFLVMITITSIKIPNEILTNMVIVLLIITSLFILLGMFLGYLFKTGETSNLASVTIACILLFFSNTILPIETLPTAIRNIVNFNPFIIGEKVLKELLIFNGTLESIATSLYYLLGMVVVLIILTYLARQLTKRWV